MTDLHWSDDPRFHSKQHYDDVMSGRATLKADDDREFISVEDGPYGPVSIYVKRENISAEDIAQQREHTKRQQSRAVCAAVYQGKANGHD